MNRAFLPLLLLAIAGQANAAQQPSPRKPVVRPNVLLITVDTVRADHIGAYGATMVKTPAIDSLAHDGALFEHAISQVPLTIASHAAILTGTYPFHNGVQDFTGQPLASNFQTVAQAFKRNGYATSAVVSSFVLDRSWGLARGFDSYFDAFPPESLVSGNIASVDRRATESVDLALGWLKHRTPGKPFFLWLHLYDPHSPYNPPGEFASTYRSDLYSGEIAYADSQLGRLFAELKRSGLYDRTAIVLLSDHGESLGEHEEREHGFFIYSSTTRVPLIIKGAGNPFAKRIKTPVQAMDTAATLLQLAKVHDAPLERQLQSKGLLPLITAAAGNTAEAELAYSETYYPFSSFGWNPLRSVQNDRYHYIDTPIAEVYDLAGDPEEKNNLAAQRPAIASALKARLTELANRYAATRRRTNEPGVSPDAAEKLRSLGYVAYRSPVSEEALKRGLPDPKSKIWEFNAIMRASDLLTAEKFVEGERLLAEVREKDPGMYLVPFLLGESALRREDWETAAAELEKCLKLNPTFDQAMTAYARALSKQKKIAEARQWVQKAIDFNPQNFKAWYQLAWIEGGIDSSAAKAALEKALSIQPNFAQAERDLGIIAINNKDYAAAADHLSRALELGIDRAPLLNLLGIAYSKTARQAKAIESYRRAIALDPRFAQAHLNLAYSLQLQGQLSAAQSEYQKACDLEGTLCHFVTQKP